MSMRSVRTIKFRTPEELEEAQREYDRLGHFSEADWETLTLKVYE